MLVYFRYGWGSVWSQPFWFVCGNNKMPIWTKIGASSDYVMWGAYWYSGGGHVNGWQRPAFGSRPPELCACMEAAVCVQTVINFYLFQTALCHWTALCLCSDGAGWSTISHDTWFYEHDGIWHRVHAAAVFRLRSQGFHLVPAGVVWTVIFLSAHNRVRIAMESTENCVAGR